MDSPSTSVFAKTATALSFSLSGGFTTVSLMTIPAFLSAPAATASQQFSLIYRIGARTQPPLTLLTALTHGYVAYRLYTTSDPGWKHWAGSGALVGAVLPFTFALMEPVSHRALKVAKDGGAGKEEIFELLRRWNGLNLGRAALAFGAGAVAIMRM